ncbi:MAG: PAS domain S-box protein [Myxococcales bacterium]|nr:PAS domain S-box protein [Myxococcales bacterium]
MGEAESSSQFPLSGEFLAAIVDAVAHPIFVKDRSFRFVMLNRAFCEMTGFNRELMLGKTDFDFFPHEESAFFRSKDEEMFASGAAVTIDEEPITDASGQRHILATTKVPLLGADGQPTHLVGIIHDITALKEAEERLRGANEDLEVRVAERTQALVATQQRLIRQERLAVVGQLAGGLAHQIRNPLGAISNASFVLRRLLGQHENPDVARAVDILLEEVQQANRIVTDLVDFARIRAPMLQRFSIDALVDDVLRRVPARPKLVVVREFGKLPDVAVDATQVVEALSNLVANSIEAMSGAGTLKFHAALAASHVVLSVEDTGTGVPKQVVDRLFEPLVTSKPHGLGLGLSLARSLIENQSGSLTYRKSESGGACFDVRLPLATQQDERASGD